MPTTAPSSAPIAAEPAAYPMSDADTDRQRRARLEERRRLRRRLNCDDVVPSIRGENSTVPASAANRYFVTPESRMNKRPRLLLVHGSVVNAELTWSAQKPLADRFELVLPNRRGFPPGPDVERVDFEDEAVWLEQFLEPGTHLVGHSYGGVISLLAAAAHPELSARSR